MRQGLHTIFIFIFYNIITHVKMKCCLKNTVWLMFCHHLIAINLASTQPSDFAVSFGRSRALTQASSSVTSNRHSSYTPQVQSQDQDTSDSLGYGIGLELGLGTPILDTILERLLRRKQLLLNAAALYQNWIPPSAGGLYSTTAGFYPNPALSPYPYAGGGGIWGRPPISPAGYPGYPFGNGWGTFNGYNPFLDLDTDFTSLKNRN
ncbi:uncharacterized protein LOC126904929 [Daktulosphaira vitifoliae]|uniref:uncharacterized protein LOC126904929 n=1 Tax=Daktulosphaira vitifoliae TaxID=58002 RepID=UPI0021A98B0A|nr:uncharacterized protein LOC126904929 [Daktulosphaira vitifoliae]